jgi:hypothetical protein
MLGLSRQTSIDGLSKQVNEKLMNYSDFYRFLVSLGVLLMGMAFVFPWLFLREPFNLLLEVSKSATLTPAAQHILAVRQRWLDFAYVLLPWISGASFILGVAVSSVGLSKWWKKQRDVIDPMEVASLRSMTETQIAEKAQAEMEEGLATPAPIKTTGLPLAQVASYRRVEEQVAAKLADLFPTRAVDVLMNMALDDVEYDAILRSKVPGWDWVVEVKYISKGFHSGWLRAVISSVVARTATYVRAARRQAKAILVIVVGSDDLVEKAMDTIRGEPMLAIRSARRRIYAAVVSESQLSNPNYTLNFPILDPRAD